MLGDRHDVVSADHHRLSGSRPVLLAVGEHLPPARLRLGEAEAEEAERALGDHQARHRQEERVACERLGNDCWRVSVRYGFMNRPDVTLATHGCGNDDWINLSRTAGSLFSTPRQFGPIIRTPSS